MSHSKKAIASIGVCQYCALVATNLDRGWRDGYGGRLDPRQAAERPASLYIGRVPENRFETLPDGQWLSLTGGPYFDVASKTGVVDAERSPCRFSWPRSGPTNDESGDRS